MTIRFFRLLTITLMFLAVVITVAAIDAQAVPKENHQEKEWIPGQYIIKFNFKIGRRQAKNFAAKNGGTVIKRLLNPRIWLFKFGKGRKRRKVLRRLKANPNIVYVESNGYVKAMFMPNDPLYKRQWNFRQIKTGKAWNKAKGKGVVVAVVDTGVAYENYYDGVRRYRRLSDLNRTNFVPGYDFVNNDTHPNDDNQHGSHVAGTIAQSTNNGRSVAGIAFKASIMPIKVLDAAGFGTFSDVANGVRWAANHGAHVVNLSLGSSSPSRAMRDAVNYARYKKNVVVIAAAGNSGTGRLSYPASYPAVMAVAATDVNRTLTWYSQHGRGLDISAPGGDTSVDKDSDGFVDGILQQTIYRNRPGRQKNLYFQGTSMAAPHVAGVAALVRSSGRKKASAINRAIKWSATDLGAPGYDTRYGYGLVNAYRAIRYGKKKKPRIIYPTSGTVLKHGTRVKIRWNRRGAKKLRYHLSYTANANANGTFGDGYEGGRISKAYSKWGNVSWFVTSATSAEGSHSARSGQIGGSQTSDISLTKIFRKGATISFSYRVSSEQNYDYFNFYIDRRRKMHRSGESGWQTASYYIAPGQHTLRWSYTKDYSAKSGSDAVFIDKVNLLNISRATWRRIVKNTKAGKSSYRWRVPNTPGSGYRIRIRAYRGSYGNWAYSKNTFTVK